jgi:hypothetical protein
MTYTIYLYQSTGEVQNVYDSESKEEIMKLWKQECSSQDEYTPLDIELVLDKDGETIDSYIIPESQKDN